MELLNPLISEYTWADKPSVAPLGQIICVTDVGENGSLWRGNGTSWIKMSVIPLLNLTTTVSLTGTTSETTMQTLSLNGGVMGPKGKLRVYIMFNVPNNANTKTLRLKTGGTAIWQLAVTAAVGAFAHVFVANMGSESSQITSLFNTTGFGGNTVTTNTTSTINTAADFVLTLTGQLGNSGDTLSVLGVFVEAC
jgi:hypothetical protein